MKMPGNLYGPQILHPILKSWLVGTTCSDCYVRRKVVFENDHYIVMHHYSHASYAGRFSSNSACAAYQELYQKCDLMDADGNPTAALKQGYKELMRWDGRLNKSKILDDCKAAGIVFTDVEIKQFSFQ